MGFIAECLESGLPLILSFFLPTDYYYFWEGIEPRPTVFN